MISGGFRRRMIITGEQIRTMYTFAISRLQGRGSWLADKPQSGRAASGGNLRGQLEKAIGIAASDPFGFGFRWDQWDTTLAFGWPDSAAAGPSKAPP